MILCKMVKYMYLNSCMDTKWSFQIWQLFNLIGNHPNLPYIALTNSEGGLVITLMLSHIYGKTVDIIENPLDANFSNAGTV